MPNEGANPKAGPGSHFWRRRVRAGLSRLGSHAVKAQDNHRILTK